MKTFTTAIAGLGARGLDTYAIYAQKAPQSMKIVALADVDPKRVKSARVKYGVSSNMCFDSAEELLNRPKLADLLILATQDRQHYDQAVKALNLGYDILLEKPISPDISECIRLRDLATKLKRKVIVCHVLRYTKFYSTIKEILESKRLGGIVSVQAIENVGYWHMAHSFVRGNWRKNSETSPMILQKSCHDFDIISWLIGKRCVRVSSFGSLKYFHKANAPKGSALFCLKAGKCRENCPYDATKIYLDNPNHGVKSGNIGWPVNILALEPTVDNISEALKDGPYGRCVFMCDNDVVDHQVASLEYEDDITVAFTMSGFTPYVSREIKIMCELGQISGDMHTNMITVNYFGGKQEIIDISTLTDDLSGHGGGDNEMMRQLFETLNGNGKGLSSIADSVHSHVIAFAAEESRLNSGKVIDIAEFEKQTSMSKINTQMRVKIYKKIGS